MLWLLIPLGFIVTLAGIAWYARRDELKPDAPGTRTVAAFCTDGRYSSDEERRDAELMGPGALGGVLLRVLAEQLKRAELTLNEPDRDDYGWGVTVERDGKRAYLLLGFVGDASEEWLLQVLDPSGGGPGPRELLPAIDAALKFLPGTSQLRWHSRKHRDEMTGRSAPLD